MHAVSVVDSYVGGSVLQHPRPAELPYLTEVIADHATRQSYDPASEFGYGLDLILDALDARRGWRPSSSVFLPGDAAHVGDGPQDPRPRYKSGTDPGGPEAALTR